MQSGQSSPCLLRIAFICVTIISVLAVSQTSQAETIDVNRRDLQLHMVSSALITGTTYYYLRKNDERHWDALVTSVALAVLLGTAKETFDKSVDASDIEANFAGALTAGGVFLTIDLLAF